MNPTSFRSLRVLVVDHEPASAETLRALLVDAEFNVVVASGGEEALKQIQQFKPAVVLAEVRLPGADGISLLRKARAEGSDAIFILMSGVPRIDDAVEAMRAGAESFVTKPVDLGAVLSTMEKVLRSRSNIVGDSPELRAVLDLIERSAPTRATVLVLGESGTGKELVAEEIHARSQRQGKPFVKVNCAALSESLLESELFGHEKGSFTGATGRPRAASSWPTEGPCSSMRLATSPPGCR